MKTLKLSIVGVLLTAAVAVPLLVQRRAQVDLRTKLQALRQQTVLLSKLSAENERLSNVAAQAKSSQSLSDAQLTELLKLRNEVGQFHRALKEMDQLRREMQRIHDGLRDLAEEKERGGENATALLADEMELRLARVAQLKQWLEETPEEKVPELQFLSEESWARSAEWQRVTDEEYRGWMSAQRSNAEARFARMTFKALKQFAQASNGQFPTDLSQLKPYFESPIDDAILQRYEIVPAKSLIESLAQVGGDWVITQKVPVNKKFDSRVAISITGHHGTVQDGRWDPVP